MKYNLISIYNKIEYIFKYIFLTVIDRDFYCRDLYIHKEI